MLINDTYKTVELFIENLHWGKISINPRLYDINPEFVENIQKSITEWTRLNGKKRDEDDTIDFGIINDELYDIYIHGRIDGMIQGELIDESNEKIIKELKEENKRKDEKINELTYQRDQTIAELARLQMTEPPLKKDFSALR